jgi:hypothetical protein
MAPGRGEDQKTIKGIVHAPRRTSAPKGASCRNPQIERDCFLLGASMIRIPNSGAAHVSTKSCWRRGALSHESGRVSCRETSVVAGTGAIGMLSGAAQQEIPWGPIMAASVIVTVPLIILVLMFQRKIVARLTAGGVKG